MTRHSAMFRFRVSGLVGLSLLLGACGGGTSSGGNTPPPPPPHLFFSVLPSPLYIYPNTSFTISIKATTNTSVTPEITSIQIPDGIALITSTTFPVAVPSAGIMLSFQTSSTMTDGTYPITFSGDAGSATSQQTVNATLQTKPPSFFFPNGLFNEIGVPFGGSGEMQFEAAANGNGYYDIQLSLSGLPSGTSATITPPTIKPGQSTTVTITADTNASQSQNVPVTLTGTPVAPVPSASTTFLVDVSAPSGSLANNRTDYVSTDATPYGAVYDAVHELIFASNPTWNRVDVISGTTHLLVKQIPVPEPRGIDISQDSSTVWVATGSRQVFAISSASLHVTRYLLPTWSIGFWEGDQIFALSDSTLMMDLTGTFNGITQLVIWNPVTNDAQFPSLPGGNTLNGFYMYRAGNGSRVYFLDSTSAGAAFYFNVSTRRFSHPVTMAGYGTTITVNKDSTRLAICDSNGPNMYDGDFNLIGTLPACGFGEAPFFQGGSVFSSDNRYLYQEVLSYVPVIAKIDPDSLNILSLAPALPMIPVMTGVGSGFYLPNPFAVDSTGMIFGIEDWGIAFDDGAFVQNFSTLQPGSSIYMQHMSPYFGPLKGGTASSGFGGSFALLPDVWYGANRGTAKNPSYLTITSPRGSAAGPVNIKMLFPDGSEVFDPLFFSYGPYLQYSVISGAPPQGNVPGQVIGYGMPGDNVNGTLTVGGASAALAQPGNDGLPWANTPFPNKVLSYTVPAGRAGWADITLTTPDGTSTLPKGMYYARSVTDYSSSDKFAAVLYDGRRQQLYLSAGDHIDVFSLNSKKFESPLTPPSVQGSLKQFAGLALTPDGGLLLAADIEDASLAVIDPDNPEAAYAIPVGSPSNSSCWVGPLYVASASNKKAFVVAGSMPGSCFGGGGDYLVDLDSHAVSPMPLGGCKANPSYIAASGDGSKIAMGAYGIGTFCIYDVASDNATSNGAYQQYHVAFSSDGNVAASGLLLADSAANTVARIAQPIVYYAAVGNNYSGPVFNAAGSLYYVPYPNFIDIIDVQHAMVRMRFSLGETVPTLSTAMPISIDASGRFIYLITDKGLAIIDLGAAPLSIGWLSSTLASAGAQVVIRGSGFDSSIIATVAGQPAVVSITDESTLTLTIPTDVSGPVSIVLTNGDGFQYNAEGLLTIE